jgi:hypothetical protein
MVTPVNPPCTENCEERTDKPHGCLTLGTQFAKGLDNLRFAYGQLGYINFTSIPKVAG